METTVVTAELDISELVFREVPEVVEIMCYRFGRYEVKAEHGEWVTITDPDGDTVQLAPHDLPELIEVLRMMHDKMEVVRMESA